MQDERINDPNSISLYNIDYVVVAIKSEGAQELIKRELIEKGIMENKIILIKTCRVDEDF